MGDPNTAHHYRPASLAHPTSCGGISITPAAASSAFPGSTLDAVDASSIPPPALKFVITALAGNCASYSS